MTTVAYKDGTLAADTMVSYGTMTNGSMSKIHTAVMPNDDGTTRRVMFAMSGLVWLTNPMQDWLEAGADSRRIPEVLLTRHKDFSCLLVDETGAIFEFAEGYFLECTCDYHAIGSGAYFALGAMAAGVSAPKAVLAASKHDKATGGDIHTLALADLNQQQAA